jgi:hypothetical protein
VNETLYSALLASHELLAAYETDGQLKSLCWPRKDAFHNHLRFFIMGLVQSGKTIWLDPKRDQLSVEWIRPFEQLQFRWHIHHPDARGLRVYLKASLLNEATIEHSFSIEGDELSSLHHTQFWFLLAPEVAGRRSQFQCVRAQPAAHSLRCDADPFTLTMSCASPAGFKNVAAVQLDSDTELGALVLNFVRHPAAFRHIEMGSCAALAVSPVVPWNQKFTVHLQVQNALEPAAASPLRSQENEPSLPFSVRVLDALTSPSGALLASAECDWAMKHSGGYGFVWPRDAAFAGLALAECGYTERAIQLAVFLANALGKDSDFEQRYSDAGQPAPSWCVRQPDQRPLVCLFWIELLQNQSLKDDSQSLIVEKLNQCLLSMADELIANPKQALSGFDLWEEREGQHFFALVCAHGALVRGGRWAPAPAVSEMYMQAAQVSAKEALAFFSGEHPLPARTRRPDGSLDLTPDASLLACLYPVSEFPLPEEKKSHIHQELKKALATGVGFRRYPDDPYRGGGCWPLVELWFGLALPQSLDPNSKPSILKDILQKTTAASNTLGLLPEQIDPQSGAPSWIVPLGWSHAFFLQLSHRLRKITNV